MAELMFLAMGGNEMAEAWRASTGRGDNRSRVIVYYGGKEGSYLRGQMGYHWGRRITSLSDRPLLPVDNPEPALLFEGEQRRRRAIVLCRSNLCGRYASAALSNGLSLRYAGIRADFSPGAS